MLHTHSIAGHTRFSFFFQLGASKRYEYSIQLKKIRIIPFICRCSNSDNRAILKCNKVSNAGKRARFRSNILLGVTQMNLKLKIARHKYAMSRTTGHLHAENSKCNLSVSNGKSTSIVSRTTHICDRFIIAN